MCVCVHYIYKEVDGRRRRGVRVCTTEDGWGEEKRTLAYQRGLTIKKGPPPPSRLGESVHFGMQICGRDTTVVDGGRWYCCTSRLPSFRRWRRPRWRSLMEIVEREKSWKMRLYNIYYIYHVEYIYVHKYTTALQRLHIINMYYIHNILHNNSAVAI